MTTRTSGTRPLDGIAKITIDRPEVRNAFRPLTVKELIRAFDVARDDPTVGVVILTGEGPDAFCSGGDQKIRGDDGYVDEQGIGRLNVLDLQIQIRRLPKPVVAMVAGYAIGGGHVLHVCCDLTIAADNARFGQTGPARRLVRRRLRHQPARAADRREAREGDLVPLPPVRRADRARVGPGERGRAAGRARGRRPSRGAARCSRSSPLALRLLKAGANAGTDGLAGVQQLAGDATLLYYMSEEAQEGRDAFKEKRAPDFSRFPKRP